MKQFSKHVQKVSILLIAIVASFAGNGSFINAVTPFGKTIKFSSHQREMLDGNNDFACDLFREVCKQTPAGQSTIMSPISVSYLLGMLYEGADGDTFWQIANTLGLGGSVEETNKFFKKIIDEAPLLDPKVKLNIANSVYVNSGRGYSLIPRFEIDMKNYYNAWVDALDFSAKSSLDLINDWCDTQTNGMIPQILYRLEPSAVMYLLNAVYFKATWVNKFDPKETRDMDFTKSNGAAVKRKMMHLRTSALYDKDEVCEMLRLPYGNGGYSMCVLLPDNGNTIEDVIKKMSAQRLKRQRTNELSTRQVDILLPRFSTTSEIPLVKVLSSLGMPSMFDSYAADFPFMVQNDDGLYVSMMKQAAKIEVDESGTKAAAVTVAQMGRWSMSSAPNVVTFHANRPFVYYIVENSTGIIFFMGTYCGD